MHASYSLAAALVALAPAVQAQGTAFINNLCNFDVYVFPTSVGDAQGPIKISANGGSYSQKYQSFSEGGMSMKLSKTEQCVDITQFEYTLTGSQVFYDVSNVDCFASESCPFGSAGLHMTSGSGCPTVTCQPGDMKCHDAYNLFNDDWATKACSTDADTTLHLCSTNGESATDAIASIGGSIASAVSSLVAAPSKAAAPQKAASTPESIAAAAEPTSTSSAAPSPSSTTPSTSAQPTTMATSVKAKPSVAAPATTEAPPANIVYTTEIAYTTQWATKWVEERSAHDDFHHRARPRSPHAHARRHQHSLE